jgi:hypothetical protein
LQSFERGVVEIGQELTHLVGPRMNEAKTGVRKARVAAGFVLRRFFQHDDLCGAGLARSYRSFKGRSAAAEYQHVDVR